MSDWDPKNQIGSPTKPYRRRSTKGVPGWAASEAANYKVGGSMTSGMLAKIRTNGVADPIAVPYVNADVVEQANKYTTLASPDGKRLEDTLADHLQQKAQERDNDPALETYARKLSDAKEGIDEFARGEKSVEKNRLEAVGMAGTLKTIERYLPKDEQVKEMGKSIRSALSKSGLSETFATAWKEIDKSARTPG